MRDENRCNYYFLCGVFERQRSHRKTIVFGKVLRGGGSMRQRVGRAKMRWSFEEGDGRRNFWLSKRGRAN